MLEEHPVLGFFWGESEKCSPFSQSKKNQWWPVPYTLKISSLQASDTFDDVNKESPGLITACNICYFRALWIQTDVQTN